jgi:hypothetical protein
MMLFRRWGWVLALWAWLAPQVAEAAVQRFAVLVGSNAGDDDEVRLRYAEDDARKLADVLADLGSFPPQNTVILEAPDADAVIEALVDVNERIRRVTARGDEAVLLVYYSGHASSDALHLGGTRLASMVFEQLVRSSSATVRLMIVDACRSGSLTRVKGGTIGAPYSVRIDETLASEGAILLTSSSAGEDSQESDELQGSFFTHYLVSGLVGAADEDGDGAVSVDEAYRHAHDRTIAESSRTVAGIQHPTYAYDLKGRGGVVLTRPGAPGRRGQLHVPEGRVYLVLRDDRDGAVVAEVGRRDAARTISLRPGTYFLVARTRDFLLEGKVVVGAGAAVTVDESTLRRSEYARLVRKGEGQRRVSHGPQTGYRLRSPLSRGGGLCHGAFVGYLVETRWVSVLPRVGWCRSWFSNDRLRSVTDEIDLELRVSHVWDFRVVSVELGLAGGTGLLLQRFSTSGEAPPRRALDGQIGAVLGLLWELPRGFYLLTDVAAQTYFMREGVGQDARVTASFTGRPSVGFGKRF